MRELNVEEVTLISGGATSGTGLEVLGDALQQLIGPLLAPLLPAIGEILAPFAPILNQIGALLGSILGVPPSAQKTS